MQVLKSPSRTSSGKTTKTEKRNQINVNNDNLNFRTVIIIINSIISNYNGI